MEVTEVTGTTITVQWGPVDCIHHNGDITGYSVQYGVEQSVKVHTINVSEEQVTLLNLMPFTNYSIKVPALFT
ncbi:fibronectin type III domain-containing protein, partial [Methylobacterium crusticola]|uniref:fibronectin type III domain-containing protein n=1 Tax=Methylobacterium crusticola TaxID=1697972 RepID=UPI0034D6A7A6